MLDRLHHDDGVVHDNTDSQHQAEKGEVIQAEPHGRHDGECAHDRHGHGHEGNQSGSPILQEHQHDQRHQDNRIEQRLANLGYRLLNERSGVINNAIADSGRELGLELFHAGFDGVGDFEGVRTGQLVDRQRHRRFAVQRTCLVVGLGSELDPGYVLQVNERAARALEDDILKLFGAFQTSFGREDVLRRLAGGCGWLTDMARCHLDVLTLNRLDYILGIEVVSGQLLRVQPQSHAVVSLTQIGNVADSGQARELVANLDRGIVAQLKAGPVIVG